MVQGISSSAGSKPWCVHSAAGPTAGQAHRSLSLAVRAKSPVAKEQLGPVTVACDSPDVKDSPCNGVLEHKFAPAKNLT